MPPGNPSPKLAITSASDVHERMVADAARRGTSVSAWSTDAARLALKVRDGLAAVAGWEAEHGPVTELDAARQRLVAARRRRRPIRRPRRGMNRPEALRLAQATGRRLDIVPV